MSGLDEQAVKISFHENDEIVATIKGTKYKFNFSDFWYHTAHDTKYCKLKIYEQNRRKVWVKIQERYIRKDMITVTVKAIKKDVTLNGREIIFAYRGVL